MNIEDFITSGKEVFTRIEAMRVNKAACIHAADTLSNRIKGLLLDAHVDDMTVSIDGLVINIYNAGKVYASVELSDKNVGEIVCLTLEGIDNTSSPKCFWATLLNQEGLL